jgi:hypothetical protein
MNTIILNCPKGLKVDHINHDTLDNRKRNLRITTNDKNTQNRKGANSNSSTGVRNVNWGYKRSEYWVQFQKNGEKFKWIFPLDKFDEAVKFAEKKRKDIFGEFAGAS